MRIAITSSDGKKVDTHFGKTNKFYIYELSATSSKFIEERSVLNFLPGRRSLDLTSEKLDTIYKLINDCAILCTTKISEIPALKLLKRGINIVESEGDLSEIFQSTN